MPALVTARMKEQDFCVEFTWLPPEDEFCEVKEFLASNCGSAFKPTRPIKKLKEFFKNVFGFPVHIESVKSKIEFDDTIKNHTSHERIADDVENTGVCIDSKVKSNRNKSEDAVFYAEYIFIVSCKVNLDREIHVLCKKLINLFCYKRISKCFPELWMKFDLSSLVIQKHITVDSFIELQAFSLGNLVGLNTFVEHFDSKTALESFGFKITQVKAKFMHDCHKLQLFFVVRKAYIKKNKASPSTHKMHKLEIPYSSICTILVSKSDSLTVYFRLINSPLLYAVEQDEEADNYISYLNMDYNTSWFRAVDIFPGCPSCLRKDFSMNSVLKLDFDNEDYDSILNISYRCKSVQIYFASISVVPSNIQETKLKLNNFDCYYALQCLFTHSFEVIDQLIVKKELEVLKHDLEDKSKKNPLALSSALYLIYNAISQGYTVVLSICLKHLYERFCYLPEISSNNESISEDNLVLIKRAIFTPTHIKFLPPQPSLKSRAIRNFDKDFSLRVSIRDSNLNTLNFTLSQKRIINKYDRLNLFFDKYFKKPLLQGIMIHKRRYKYVGSSTSQFKGHGLWFYAEDNSKRTAEDIRKAFGNMEKIKQVPKYMARMGQTFSQAMGNITVPQMFTNVNDPEEDIQGGMKEYLSDTDSDDGRPKKFLKERDEGSIMEDEPYIFSDGIGRISLEIAEKVYQKLNIEDLRPSAMQIRYAGCKGMLVVDPRLEGERIVFRESMKKFSSDDESLEILKYSEKRNAYLNRPLITILEQLGISKEVFVRLQKEMIQNHIKSMFHEYEACNVLNRNSMIRINFLKIFESGICLTEDPLFKSMIYSLFRKRIELLKNKGNIEIPANKGRAMFGVLDETFTLEYGQVFVQYSVWETDKPIVLKGTVIVTKNPCMHPGDVRKFEAIDVPDLHHIRDCIVFPAKGCRPHPDEMAGSDLDGDEYHVMWLEDFIFGENKSPMHFATRKDKSKDLSRPIEPSDELDHLRDFIFHDNVGLIANAHLVFADSLKDGIFSNKCMRLAKNYAIALDFAKSGKVASRSKQDSAFKYPDFMQKLGEKDTYLSRKALGLLYRNCKRLELGLETGRHEIEYKVDNDFVKLSCKKYESSAIKTYNKYCEKINFFIQTYGFENEGQLLSGAILNPPKNYEVRHDLDNLIALLECQMRDLFRTIKKGFFQEFGHKPKKQHEEDSGDEPKRRYSEEMYKKACTWYSVAYNDYPNKKYSFFGFPWAVDDVLIEYKVNQIIFNAKKDKKIYNSKTLLEDIVDKSISKNLTPLLKPDEDTAVIYKNRFEALEVACKILEKWLKIQTDHFFISDFKSFKKNITSEFRKVTGKIETCDINYIRKLKEAGNIKKAISPCYYIIETMLGLAKLGASQTDVMSDIKQELGLLSWVTLIKLACTYNPQYLGIHDKNESISNSLFYMPQDNIIETIQLPLYYASEANKDFSLKLVHEENEIISYLKKQTRVKTIVYRPFLELDKRYYAKFTIEGTRYSIEKLKDIVVLDEFYSYVLRGMQFYS